MIKYNKSAFLFVDCNFRHYSSVTPPLDGHREFIVLNRRITQLENI